MKSLALLLCLGSSSLLAQNSSAATARQARTPIAFECTCKDATGAAFAMALRDALATSPRYIEADKAVEKSAAGGEIKNWQIKAVSLDPFNTGNGTAGTVTALSIVFLYGDSLFLEQFVETCKLGTIATCASGTLADYDQMLSDLRTH